MRRLAGRPALLALVGGLVVARLAWHPGRALCGQMTMGGCLGVAVLVVAVLGLATWFGRASWLAISAAREIAGLPRLQPADALVVAARRTGVGEVVCLESAAAAAFCAGLLRPRVFVTSGMVASLADDELDAVLVHEAEHAHRRDPLRRLAGRAAADVLFWLPLIVGGRGAGWRTPSWPPTGPLSGGSGGPRWPERWWPPRPRSHRPRVPGSTGRDPPESPSSSATHCHADVPHWRRACCQCSAWSSPSAWPCASARAWPARSWAEPCPAGQPSSGRGGWQDLCSFAAIPAFQSEGLSLCRALRRFQATPGRSWRRLSRGAAVSC
jgi:hypothetical protein